MQYEFKFKIMTFPFLYFIDEINKRKSIAEEKEKKDKALKDFEFSLFMRGDLPSWILNDETLYEKWRKKQIEEFKRKNK